MPIAPHRRSSHAQHEQSNLLSLTSLTLLFDTFKQLYYDHITPELTIYALKSLRDLIFMGAELLTENTMIQVISSLQHHRTPLRDLAEEYFSNDNRTFLEFAYMGESTYQVDTDSVLFLWIFYCFFHGPRGLRVLQKGVRCLTIARALRVITFSITILPNPNPNCTFTGPIQPLNLSPGNFHSSLHFIVR